MLPPTDDVKNWMNMFRWIVKLIRDEFGIEEPRLIRGAVLETELGLGIEQVEELLSNTARAFGIRFPPATLNEVLKLDELCMLAAWLKGLYKQPEFLSAGFVGDCRASNPQAG
ncbi:MAG: acyl carrier protein [Alphaproteobacteria bacterium]|nr:acyl carrier protein [Alphaproteobacteria bacterium]